MNVDRCWTEPDLIQRFFAPAPGKTVEAVVDPGPCGRFYALMRIEEHADIGSGAVSWWPIRSSAGLHRRNERDFTAQRQAVLRPYRTFTNKGGGCD